jgi:hypothetical protein
MYSGYKVVACTPAGRRRYLEILSQYIAANRGVVDEWHLWLNTAEPGDVAYIESLAESQPEFVKIKRCGTPTANGYGVAKYYHYCIDDGTVYLKIDDDVVFVDRDCIPRLVQCKLNHPDSFLVFANTINNAVCSHILRRIGAIPISFGFVAWDAADPLGWASPEFARDLHEHFLRNSGDLERFYYPDYHLYDYIRFSINFFAWTGADFRRHFGGTDDDECYLSVQMPRELSRYNIICGNALASHFAYYTQRVLLDSTDILAKYKALAERQMSC